MFDTKANFEKPPPPNNAIAELTAQWNRQTLQQLDQYNAQMMNDFMALMHASGGGTNSSSGLHETSSVYGHTTGTNGTQEQSSSLSGPQQENSPRVSVSTVQLKQESLRVARWQALSRASDLVCLVAEETVSG
ncbi:expressed unknown protein [Seminavis robusta]|uniref:Uncharacterized protein n=1 Tax=Seminavis robusta TaxID=568900 RepID=A0A9N8EHG9_9STRA|nr:expressed unknown protein [Seminavis robusta]|eukprot:Sro1104_g241850.1 n/a (133) ;mRNA; f:30238-30636